MAQQRAISPLPLRNSSSNKAGEKESSFPEATHLPLSDILVVESLSTKKQQQRSYTLRLTTQTHGFYVFDNLNLNSRDVLLAFLKANIASERIMEGSGTRPDDLSVPSLGSANSSSSMDVDKLTSEKMRRCSERESFGEKVSRRTTRIAIILSDICSSISDSACCRGRGTDDEPTKEMPSESRKSIQLDQGNLEEEDSTVSSVVGRKRDVRKKSRVHPMSVSSTQPSPKNQEDREKARESLRANKFPSGLSVELDPASEELEN